MPFVCAICTEPISSASISSSAGSSSTSVSFSFSIFAVTLSRSLRALDFRSAAASQIGVVISRFFLLMASLRARIPSLRRMVSAATAAPTALLPVTPDAIPPSVPQLDSFSCSSALSPAHICAAAFMPSSADLISWSMEARVF